MNAVRMPEAANYELPITLETTPEPSVKIRSVTASVRSGSSWPAGPSHASVTALSHSPVKRVKYERAS